MSENNSTMLLVKMMGTFCRMMPYTSHIMTEMVAKVNISSEMSAADLVFHVLITCGRKVMEEMQPAVIPNRSSEVMVSSCGHEIRGKAGSEGKVAVGVLIRAGLEHQNWFHRLGGILNPAGQSFTACAWSAFQTATTWVCRALLYNWSGYIFGCAPSLRQNCR